MKLLKIPFLLQIVLVGFVIQLYSCASVAKEHSPQDNTSDDEGVPHHRDNDGIIKIDRNDDEDNSEMPIELTEEEKLQQAILEQNILNGVAVNMSLHQNDTVYGFADSAPGCPQPEYADLDNPWVYYNDTGDNQLKCYLTGRQGPCPKNMTLYGQTFSYFGYCDCNCKERNEAVYQYPKAYCTSYADYRDSKRQFKERVLAYVKEWNSCHVIFEQGLCPTGEWLVFGNNPRMGPFCEPRRCPPATEEHQLSFYHFKTQECHIVGGTCGNSSTSYFEHRSGSWHPDCQETREIRAHPQWPSTLTPSVNVNACSRDELFSKRFQKCIRKTTNSNFSIG